jgi:dihydrofolate reductase
MGETIDAAHDEAFDLLLGRRTAEPTVSRATIGRKPRTVRWRTVLTRRRNTSRPTGRTVSDAGRSKTSDQDIVEGVRRIRAKDGPDLIVWGSSTLTPVLLEHGLADEVLLLVRSC